jgi:rhamnosyltransferase
VTSEDICAVVVTFHPERDTLENVVELRQQFNRLIVIDNGSLEKELGALRSFSEERHVELIENGRNLGIATALNIGVARAVERGCNGVAFFDQDSTVTEGFLSNLLTSYNANPQRENVAIVSPRHWDRNSKAWLKPQFMPDGNLRIAITSGSMVPISVFTRCGTFADEYFIDMVDTEFSLRVRSRGFTIVLAKDAHLVHSIGNLRSHSFLGVKRYTVSHHSAFRRYYMTRNRLTTLIKYWHFEPRLCYHIPKSIVMDSFIILLFETQRLRKLGNTVLGIMDALCRKKGRVIAP